MKSYSLTINFCRREGFVYKKYVKLCLEDYLPSQIKNFQKKILCYHLWKKWISWKQCNKRLKKRFSINLNEHTEWGKRSAFSFIQPVLRNSFFLQTLKLSRFLIYFVNYTITCEVQVEMNILIDSSNP